MLNNSKGGIKKMSERQTKAGKLAHLIARSLDHSIARSLDRSITWSINHLITFSISHSLTLDMLNKFRSLDRSITWSLDHSFNLSFTHSWHAEQVLFSSLCSKVAVYRRKLQWFFFDLLLLLTTLSCDFWVHRAGSQLKIGIGIFAYKQRLLSIQKFVKHVPRINEREREDQVPSSCLPFRHFSWELWHLNS